MVVLVLAACWQRAGRLVGTSNVSPVFEQVARELEVDFRGKLAAHDPSWPRPLVVVGVWLRRARYADLAAQLDYGMGQRGVEAASRFYFEHDAATLSFAESALLCGLAERPPQRWLDGGSLKTARATALERLRPRHPEVEHAAALSLEQLVPAYVSPRERGAVEHMPGAGPHVDLVYGPDPAGLPRDVGLVAPRLAFAIAEFAREAAFLHDLTVLEHLGAWSDRLIRGSTTRVSAHAYGQAFDVSAFRLADGRRIAVADHDEPAVLDVLAPIEATLSLYCDLLITWRSEPLMHQDHYHCEVIAPRPGADMLRP